MVNIKPSRFGPLSRLFAAYDFCDERGIGAYGGGQTELGVGRDHIQYLAAIFHPDTPNDVAPREFNNVKATPGLQESPLQLEPPPRGSVSPASGHLEAMVKEFREFILRGNLVELAVAVVIGTAFAAVVSAFVADLITPLIAAVGGEQDFSEADVRDQRQHVPLRRLHQRAAHVRDHRGGGVLLRGQAGERADGAPRHRAGRGAGDARMPGLPQQHPGGRTALRVLHGGALGRRLSSRGHVGHPKCGVCASVAAHHARRPIRPGPERPDRARVRRLAAVPRPPPSGTTSAHFRASRDSSTTRRSRSAATR